MIRAGIRVSSYMVRVRVTIRVGVGFRVRAGVTITDLGPVIVRRDMKERQHGIQIRVRVRTWDRAERHGRETALHPNYVRVRGRLSTWDRPGGY